jgi:diaminopropionate ammonia-lyase
MVESPAHLFAALWPGKGAPPLMDLPGLASLCGLRRVIVKDESRRGLGNFKSLGGTYAGMRALARAMGDPTHAALLDARGSRRTLPTLICASAGNHGLAVAAAAESAGTHARIYLHAGVSDVRVRRLCDRGAELVRLAGTYDDAVEAAARAPTAGEGLLISDISGRSDDRALGDVMAGYDVMAQEIVGQLPGRGEVELTHLFVQAGVGGLAAALAQGLCERLARPLRVVVVEPAAARCVAAGIAAGIAAGRPVRISGDLASAAEMLSCGQVSAPALEVLLRHRATTIGVDNATLMRAVSWLAQVGGPATTPSGAAGLAGLLAAQSGSPDIPGIALSARSQVLLVVTEGP